MSKCLEYKIHGIISHLYYILNYKKIQYNLQKKINKIMLQILLHLNKKCSSGVFTNIYAFEQINSYFIVGN